MSAYRHLGLGSKSEGGWIDRVLGMGMLQNLHSGFVWVIFGLGEGCELSPRASDWPGNHRRT
jgi:hypothetical protein